MQRAQRVPVNIHNRRFFRALRFNVYDAIQHSRIIHVRKEKRNTIEILVRWRTEPGGIGFLEVFFHCAAFLFGLGSAARDAAHRHTSFARLPLVVRFASSHRCAIYIDKFAFATL